MPSVEQFYILKKSDLSVFFFFSIHGCLAVVFLFFNLIIPRDFFSLRIILLAESFGTLNRTS